jgi:hypothetical protein
MQFNLQSANEGICERKRPDGTVAEVSLYFYPYQPSENMAQLRSHKAHTRSQHNALTLAHNALVYFRRKSCGRH